MNHKARALFIIMACIFVPAKPDQGLDCRKLVYSRNCRGVALKRGYSGNGETQSGVVLDGVSLKGLLNSLYTATETQTADEGFSSPKKIPLQTDSDFVKDQVRFDALPRLLLFGNKPKGVKNDNSLMYEY